MELLTQPAENGAVVTPSDSVNIPMTRGILVGVAGNISVEMVGTGTSSPAHTLVIPVVAGIMYPIRCTRVNSTSTTATGIVAFW